MIADVIGSVKPDKNYFTRIVCAIDHCVDSLKQKHQGTSLT